MRCKGGTVVSPRNIFLHLVMPAKQIYDLNAVKKGSIATLLQVEYGRRNLNTTWHPTARFSYLSHTFFFFFLSFAQLTDKSISAIIPSALFIPLKLSNCGVVVARSSVSFPP